MTFSMFLLLPPLLSVLLAALTEVCFLLVGISLSLRCAMEVDSLSSPSDLLRIAFTLLYWILVFSGSWLMWEAI